MSPPPHSAVVDPPNLEAAYELWRMLENQIHLANQKANLLTVANAGQMTLFGFLWSEDVIPDGMVICGLMAATVAFVFSIWASSPFDLGRFVIDGQISRPREDGTPFFFVDLVAAGKRQKANPLTTLLSEVILNRKSEELLKLLVIDIEAKAKWAYWSFTQLTRAVVWTISPSVVTLLAGLMGAFIAQCVFLQAVIARQLIW